VPIYEYTCKSCEAKFEKLIRTMAGGEKVDCPKCGSTKTVRALSTFAVGAEQQKGSSPPGMCGRCGGPGPCALD
jgi:putative FmdB family regulatory protein